LPNVVEMKNAWSENVADWKLAIPENTAASKWTKWKVASSNETAPQSTPENVSDLKSVKSEKFAPEKPAEPEKVAEEKSAWPAK